VNLIDIYPTLIELCGLPPNPENDGRSFASLLANPTSEWNHPTLTTYQHKNHSITDGRFRYTWYGGRAEGAEELYDHSTDPMEYQNLSSDPDYRAILARLKKHLPTHHEPDSPTNPHNELKKNFWRKKKT
jgi:arylsulfatase A-like enzyme